LKKLLLFSFVVLMLVFSASTVFAATDSIHLIVSNDASFEYERSFSQDTSICIGAGFAGVVSYGGNSISGFSVSAGMKKYVEFNGIEPQEQQGFYLGGFIGMGFITMKNSTETANVTALTVSGIGGYKHIFNNNICLDGGLGLGLGYMSSDSSVSEDFKTNMWALGLGLRLAVGYSW